MNGLAILAASTAGAAVLLLIVGIFWRTRPVTMERLERLTGSAPQTSALTGGGRPGLAELVAQSPLLVNANRLVERRVWSEQLGRDLARADLTLRPIEYLAIRAGTIVVAIGLFLIAGSTLLPTLASPLALVVAGVLGYVLPRIYVARRQQARLNAFNSHLADTITLVANALRSGSSLLQAVELVVRETAPPISTEFGRVIREINLGLTTEQALNNMVRRVRSADLELMATAIAIQYQVGGNLAEILDTISYTIRERVRIKGEIRTMTATQRLSGYVIAALPVGVLLVIAVLAPSFIGTMFEDPPDLFGLPLGVVLLGSGGVLMMIGFYAIRRIVDIEV
jgi:tight adherence protein B